MQKCKEFQRLHASYSALLSSFQNHNIETAQKSINNIKALEGIFWPIVDSYLSEVDTELKALQDRYISNEDYLHNLKATLEDKGINPDVAGNTLIIGPVEVQINVDEYHILLVMGRKKQRITDLELNKVTKLLEQTYKKLNYSFNANAFFKRLLRAYEYASSRVYTTKETKYGYAVSLKVMFDIFTIAPSSADYKIENFLWDLGRLISSSEGYDPYRLEYGFSRDVRTMYIIKTASGENMKASTLTIYKEE
ncbi:MAG: hypothetical protein U1C33_02705 [Candidatus Cloacimonadaceae bacterium]|nr:hypothetical protein [Candidatus Cloacimonadaceae bacterium]